MSAEIVIERERKGKCISLTFLRCSVVVFVGCVSQKLQRMVVPSFPLPESRLVGTLSIPLSGSFTMDSTLLSFHVLQFCSVLFSPFPLSLLKSVKKPFVLPSIERVLYSSVSLQCTGMLRETLQCEWHSLFPLTLHHYVFLRFPLLLPLSMSVLLVV